MKAGGPWEMYRLMGMKRPKKPEPVKLKEPTADGLRLSLSDTDIVKELGRADKIAQTKDARDLSPVVAEGDTVTASEWHKQLLQYRTCDVKLTSLYARLPHRERRFNIEKQDRPI
mmetsp:Transcript_8504/g.19707  ORF Transcript_8504/g.19707 Transcript_8504/m.19707 type:complete len:115 (-) Transcript_8504:422-766(-)